jgi:hypothetical protein
MAYPLLSDGRVRFPQAALSNHRGKPWFAARHIHPVLSFAQC